MRLNPLLEAMAEYPMSELQERKARLLADGVQVFDFSVGDPVEPTPGFIRDAAAAAVPIVSQYPSVRGTQALRQAAAGWLQRRFSVEVDPERHLLPAGGSKEAIFHLPFAFLDTGGDRRVVLYPDPGYPVYDRGALFAGGEPIGLPHVAENGYQPEPSDLPAAVADRVAIVWVNYPHNPTGAVADAGYLARVLAWARERDVLVCSDECYADLYYDVPPVSLLEVAAGDFTNLLVFHSTSKRSGMTGYRTGFMVGDPAAIDALRKLRPSIGVASPVYTDAAAAAAWADDGHAADRRTIFRAKRDVLREFFDRAGLQLAASEATFYLWVAVPGGNDEAFSARLLEHGVLVTPGRSFGTHGKGYVRLALVPTVEECLAAVVAMQGAL